ncbi:uncharacterized protein LOC100879547 isoform X2 [Megachile rotundata]|uniref:uncharacterized protein LOC100879547 isoform X2 n=1 Tax=Megachile rotundata TaxID=143995 RepID=UPI003FD09132
MTISALDKNTVKLIRTTQIIVSVSTAAKELIENALDANAKNIEVNLIDNGCTLIEVKDDGCGISKVDAPYMALPSYTSKIVTFSDLDSLESYGFRGEALHALSTISDLTIISKTEEDEAAVSYDIDHNGQIKKSEQCHRARGTTVQVKQLFKQLPVRRQIITNSRKANQEVKITTTLEEAVAYILGRKVTSNMSWINIEDAEINGKLMVPSKESQNISEVFQSGAQYIFVNNRPIKHRELEKVVTKTILKALEQDSSSKKKPICLLYILMSAANIDINLEPNKTCVFFKEENIILNTVQKHLENFYGIQTQEQEETVCNQSLNEYQDYTPRENIPNVEDEQPACKIRRVHRSENVVDTTENVQYSKDNEEPSVSEKEQNHSDKTDDSCQKNIENFNLELPSLNLSDSESNDSQKFKLFYNDKDSSDTASQIPHVDLGPDFSMCLNSPKAENEEQSANIESAHEKNESEKNTDDSPPFELSPGFEASNQKPNVDLGPDFPMCISTPEKENEGSSANVKNLCEKKQKSETKKCGTLKEWSKGHISGVKGGTDVQPYNCPELNESLDAMNNKNVCGGFRKFMKTVGQQVMKENKHRNLTAAQIANVITNLWKELPSEKRAYYRDLAREEKTERETKKREKEEKQVEEMNRNRNRLLKALEKMRKMNPEDNKNLLVRTLVPWNLDLKKISESSLDNYTCKNTNHIVGQLRSGSWVVHKSSHIWILNAATLKKELHKSDMNDTQETAEDMEQLLKQWFSTKDDLSILYPIHSLPENTNIKT